MRPRGTRDERDASREIYRESCDPANNPLGERASDRAVSLLPSGIYNLLLSLSILSRR